MRKGTYFFFVTFIFFAVTLSVSAQDFPDLVGTGEVVMISGNRAVLYEQMADAGANSLSSQNFETGNDPFDNQAADDFVVPTPGWTIESIELLGVYFNGPGPVTSVNVWFYQNSGTLPGTQVAERLNVVPSAGLPTGSFTIPISPVVDLAPGHYWVSVQANMDFVPNGQWGWTEHMPFNNPSAWRNPGGGFGTPCTNWGARVATCGVGTAPFTDLAFRLNGTVVPVELTSFTATTVNKDVVLNWSTATELNNQGFEIERSLNGEFITIGFVAGHGTTTEAKNYSFTDQNVANGSYSYRLKQVDFDGTFEYSPVVEVDVEVPTAYALEQNYPNPFNPSTKINFSLASESKVTLKIFDVLGQEVITLFNGNLSAQSHSIDFNASGLNSGVYFYTIEATGVDGNSFMNTKKMILTK